MGWSSGSELMLKVIHILDTVSCPELEDVFHDLINAFEDFDCDNLHECLGENDAFDTAFAEMYPEHYKELMEN